MIYVREKVWLFYNNDNNNNTDYFERLSMLVLYLSDSFCRLYHCISKWHQNTLWVSHWIIHLTDLFRHIGCFSNRRLCPS